MCRLYLRRERRACCAHVQLRVSHVLLTCSFLGAPFTEWSPARWLLVSATAVVLGCVRGRLINTIIIYYSLITISGVFTWKIKHNVRDKCFCVCNWQNEALNHSQIDPFYELHLIDLWTAPQPFWISSFQVDIMGCSGGQNGMHLPTEHPIIAIWNNRIQNEHHIDKKGLL